MQKTSLLRRLLLHHLTLRSCERATTKCFFFFFYSFGAILRRMRMAPIHFNVLDACDLAGATTWLERKTE